MPGTNNKAYYTEREQQCLMMAEHARDPAAREAHLKLASLYARRAESVQAHDESPFHRN